MNFRSGPTTVVIGLGSNVPDRLRWLKCGLRAFRNAEGIEIVAVSKVYESAPMGEGFEGDFLNAILVGTTSIPSMELLKVCFSIERSCGRDREREKTLASRNRTLDCDIIFYGDLEIKESGLEIPHPRWKERPFVILPLLDVADFLTEHQREEVLKAYQELPSGSCQVLNNVLD